MGRTNGRESVMVRPDLLVVPIVVAAAVLAVFVLHDGFGWGDVLGALLIGLALFAVLAALRRYR